MKRLNAATMIFILSIAMAGYIVPSKFTITRSPSLRYRVFYLDRSPDAKSLKRGDYVMFVLKDKRVENGRPVNVTKEIGCAAGDTLSVQGKDYHCNGSIYLGKAKDYALNGERLESFIFNGRIPGGEVFVTGHHKDSFDSRYLGFVRVEDIKAKAYPVF
jgi:type IV secretory pathway protease TraF